MMEKLLKYTDSTVKLRDCWVRTQNTKRKKNERYKLVYGPYKKGIIDRLT